MTFELIHNLDDPRLRPFHNVKRVPPSLETGRFIAEGPIVAERVFRSGVPVESVLISERKLSSFADRIPAHLTTYQLPHRLAQELTGFSFHCGVLVRAHRPVPPVLDEVIPATGPALMLTGERISDPENVGALIRIGAAFGANALVFGPGTADPFSRRVVRVSMGNGLFTPIVESRDLDDTLTELRDKHEFTIYGTLPDGPIQPLETTRFSPRSVIILGHEFDGISHRTMSQVTASVGIPMSKGTDSINVAVAAGIFAYTWRSQNSSATSSASPSAEAEPEAAQSQRSGEQGVHK